MKAPTSEGYKRTRDILRENRLVTVCEEAGCPNVGECWSQGHATMMIMGEICTRGCTFCNVATGRPDALDVFEPGAGSGGGREARAEPRRHHLGRPRRPRGRRRRAHRPDHPRRAAQEPGNHDRGLGARLPALPASALETVVAAKPDVFNHNLETVPGLYPEVRPGARYFHSLRISSG